MVHFPPLPSPAYVFSGRYSGMSQSGFPHSEIPGSKPVCRLPEAYRRPLRPSSPVIAKASTTCTYSLDPITLSPRACARRFAGYR